MRITQKQVVNANLDPTKGREQRGVRPVVVISAEPFHESGLCIVVPLTSKTKGYFGDVLIKKDSINNLKLESTALVGHARSISLTRIVGQIGFIQDAQLIKIFEGLDSLCGR